VRDKFNGWKAGMKKIYLKILIWQNNGDGDRQENNRND
jgi:hypothetical protein